jgi:hypothetical protein
MASKTPKDENAAGKEPDPAEPRITDKRRVDPNGETRAPEDELLEAEGPDV